MKVSWKEIGTYGGAKMEEHLARRAGFTLRVRGPRGGSRYHLTVDRTNRSTGCRETLASGICVERSVAMSIAENLAVSLAAVRNGAQ